MSLEQPGGGGLAKREIPASLPAESCPVHLLPRLGADVWQRRSPWEGRAGRKLHLELGCATCRKANLKADGPLIFKQVKNSFLPSSYCCYPQGLQLDSGSPVAGTAQPQGCRSLCQGLQPDRTCQTKLTSVLSRRKLLHGGISIGAGNVSQVWLSSFLGLRSRIKLYLLLL